MKIKLTIIVVAIAVAGISWLYGVEVQEAWSNLWLSHLSIGSVKSVKIGGLFQSGYFSIRLWSAIAGFCVGLSAGWTCTQLFSAGSRVHLVVLSSISLVIVFGALVLRGWLTYDELTRSLTVRNALQVTEESQQAKGKPVIVPAPRIVSNKLVFDRTVQKSSGVGNTLSVLIYSDKNTLSFGRVALVGVVFSVFLSLINWSNARHFTVPGVALPKLGFSSSTEF